MPIMWRGVYCQQCPTVAAIVLQNVGRTFTDGRFQKGDAIVMLHYAFQAVKKSIEAYVTRAGGSIIVVHLSFPVNSNEEIIIEFRKGFARG
ncbi:L-cysteine desulfhydrase [Olea europaea subsp. europaea]|uniref:L-cysteine desulfhydrase n=1 Tax=Olea europaea subsp. europaea TaxID=158383 RepID=A0A8S0VD29_OLEEU|nr:L-cysteine desulfhydrase [Olea europaea subsp. europaea]